MTILFQTFISFFATLFFAIVFNAPKKLLIPCGFVGATGWIVYYIAIQYNVSLAIAAFLGSLSLSLIANIFARYFKRPVIIFYVAGIIPLVPGGVAYDATKNLVIADYSEAISRAMEATVVSGAIAFGILNSEIIFQTYIKFNHLIKRKL